jgi:SAM-dependent methyltransferase
MSEPKKLDVWAIGDAYEPYIGRWSRPVAAQFLNWLALPAGGRWLDVGCGTGALTQTILQRASPQRVVAVDSSDAFITYARERIRDRRAAFRVGDAQDLHVESASFDGVVSGLMLNFVSSPHHAVSEMRRAARPGATVAAYVWDYAADMQLLRYFWKAAVALNPATSILDEGARFPDCRPEPLSKLFVQAGLENVEVRPIDVPTVFKDFNDYWAPFLGGQGPAPGYCMSLSDHERAALGDRIKKILPTQPDGSIRLIARAWAVKGTK